jgi:hypothetical protein
VVDQRHLPASFGIVARSRALLADDRVAEDLYREAIERLENTRIVVHLAAPA